MVDYDPLCQDGRMTSVETTLDQRQAAAFSERCPGWQAWRSLVGRQWHARLLGAIPPVMVHDDTIDGLAGQVEALTGR
jgi:hypothetical protein